MNWIVVSIFSSFVVLASVLGSSLLVTGVKAYALKREVGRRRRSGKLGDADVARAAAKARELSGMSRKLQRVAMGIAIAGSVVLIGVGCSLFQEARRWRKDRAHALGVVTGFMGPDGAFPRVSFSPSPAERITFIMRVGGGGPFAYRQGDAVAVLYDPARPAQARVDSFSQLWFVPIFVTLFGVVLLLVPVLFFTGYAHERHRLALEPGSTPATERPGTV